MSKKGSRYLAMQRGEQRYVSDIPCKRGHLTERITATGTCIECRKLNTNNRYKANTDKFLDKAKEYRIANRKLINGRRREAYIKNADVEKAIARIRSAEWRKANPNHEGAKLAKRKYAESPKGKALRSKHNTTRRTGLKQATPGWANMQDIGDIYMEAAYMQMQVDHIVPLRNKLVCGLHVWDNLQLMDALTNNQKGNRHWPDMPA